MCWGCHTWSNATDAHREAYTGEIHLLDVGDEFYFAEGMGDHPAYLYGICSNVRIPGIPVNDAISYLNDLDATSYNISRDEAYWIARALYDNDFNSVKEVFDLENQ